MDIIIIGNGPAGNNLASKLDSTGFKVNVFSNEAVSFYSRIRLPSCLGSIEKLDTLCAKNEPSYIHHEEVLAIHRESKTIKLTDGETIHYDKLVLATGSNPINFFRNSPLSGIYTLRTYEDAKTITNELESPICVIGGGLLGLEAALDINNLKHQVTVIQGDAYVLNKQLNEEAAKIVSEKCKQRENLDIICGQFVKTIDGDKRIEKVVLQNGVEIPCKTLILAAGVRPSISLAKECNLDTNLAIKINEYCQTSDKDIYAIGDCAEFDNKCPGLMPIALATANVAYNHIAGSKTPYVEPAQLPTRFQADDLSVASFGVLEGDCHSKRDDDRYEAWYIKDNKVVGIILVGSKSHLSLAKASLNKEVENIDILLDF